MLEFSNEQVQMLKNILSQITISAATPNAAQTILLVQDILRKLENYKPVEKLKK